MAKIKKHNAEADLGKYAYKMGLNKFCMLVCFYARRYYERKYFFFCVFPRTRPEKNSNSNI